MAKAPSQSVQVLNIEELSSTPESCLKQNHIVVRATALSPFEILSIVREYPVRHVCQTDNHCGGAAELTASLMLNQSELVFEKPLASILNPHEVEYISEESCKGFEMIFSKGAEKEDLLDGLLDYVSKFCSRQSILRDIRLVADELFTNAVYNAPFVDRVDEQESGAPRMRAEVSMGDKKWGRMFSGVSGKSLVIGCEDNCGTLHLSSLINRIAKCYAEGPGKVMNLHGSGGAGIGSYLVFDITSSYFALVEPGVRTMVCCLINLKKRVRDQSSQSKNLHLFEANN